MIARAFAMTVEANNSKNPDHQDKVHTSPTFSNQPGIQQVRDNVFRLPEPQAMSSLAFQNPRFLPGSLTAAPPVLSLSPDVKVEKKFWTFSPKIGIVTDWQSNRCLRVLGFPIVRLNDSNKICGRLSMRFMKFRAWQAFYSSISGGDIVTFFFISKTVRSPTRKITRFGISGSTRYRTSKRCLRLRPKTQDSCQVRWRQSRLFCHLTQKSRRNFEKFSVLKSQL